MDKKFAHSSGATSSHLSPFNAYPTWEGMKLTSARFLLGNQKHEDDNTVYREANWLRAFLARDVNFFRDRWGHAIEHAIDEQRGKDDPDAGGNLGAVGWYQDTAAFVKKHDPFLYGAIQGKWRVEDSTLEEAMMLPRTNLEELFTGSTTVELLKLSLAATKAPEAPKKGRR